MVLVHQSVRSFSAQFAEELRRYNYVTVRSLLAMHEALLACNPAARACQLDEPIMQCLTLLLRLANDILSKKTCSIACSWVLLVYTCKVVMCIS